MLRYLRLRKSIPFPLKESDHRNFFSTQELSGFSSSSSVLCAKNRRSKKGCGAGLGNEGFGVDLKKRKKRKEKFCRNLEWLGNVWPISLCWGIFPNFQSVSQCHQYWVERGGDDALCWFQRATPPILAEGRQGTTKIVGEQQQQIQEPLQILSQLLSPKYCPAVFYGRKMTGKERKMRPDSGGKKERKIWNLSKVTSRWQPIKKRKKSPKNGSFQTLYSLHKEKELSRKSCGPLGSSF